MKLSKLISILFLAIGLLNANPINLQEKDGYEVKLQSEKPLVVGTNTLVVTLAKDAKMLTNAKVKIKFFMPEMPGMPYMENEKKAKLVGGKYKISVNLSMGGTWQYHLMFKTEDGKVHKIRSSVNL